MPILLSFSFVGCLMPSDRQTGVHFRRWTRVNEGTLSHGVTTIHVFMYCDTMKTSALSYLEEF